MPEVRINLAPYLPIILFWDSARVCDSQTGWVQSSKMFGNLINQILVLWKVAVIKANLNKP